MRSLVKWTLIVAGLLFVALLIAAAFVGGTGKSHSKPQTSKRTSRARTIRVPLGRAAAVGQGWRLRALSTTPNAGSAVRAVPGQYASPIPAGAQDFIVTVAATYVGGGKANIRDLADLIHAVGRHHATYSLTIGNGCGPGETKLPAPDLQSQIEEYVEVFSGRTVKGNVCFQIARNDARSLVMYVEPPLTLSGKQGHRVWFALR